MRPRTSFGQQKSAPATRISPGSRGAQLLLIAYGFRNASCQSLDGIIRPDVDTKALGHGGQFLPRFVFEVQHRGIFLCGGLRFNDAGFFGVLIGQRLGAVADARRGRIG